MKEMASENVEVVHHMYECFKTGNMERLRAEIFHPDIVWNLPGHHPLAGQKKGVDEVLGFFGKLRGAGLRVTPLGMGELTNGAVAEVYKAEGEGPDGAKLDVMNCNYYTIRDGKIAEVTVIMGDQHNYDAFFWKAFQLKPVHERLA